MNRLTILVDMDNVIADQRAGFYRVLSQRYPEIELPPQESITSFDFENAFPERYRELVLSVRLEKGFFRSLPAVDGAIEGLRMLADGHDVFIVTAPTWEWRYCVPEKYAWVEEKLGRDWMGRMILTRDKTLVRGDILIDDSPAVKGVLHPTWEHMVFAQPYNALEKHKERVTWETMEEVIDAWLQKNANNI